MKGMMPAQLTRLWRTAVDANVRYYQRVGRLSVEYLRAAAGLLHDLGAPLRGEPDTGTGPPGDAPARAAAAMVLEGEAGTTAPGVFLVDNALERQVTAPVVASDPVGEDGQPVAVALEFDPPEVTLGAGEQILVRVGARITDALEVGRTYRGALTVPGLTSAGIPFVVRRRPAGGSSGDAGPGTTGDAGTGISGDAGAGGSGDPDGSEQA